MYADNQFYDSFNASCINQALTELEEDTIESWK